MEKKLRTLYLIENKKGNFYVVAETPNDAIAELKRLLNKADWWYSQDRDPHSIKMVATEYHCFPDDKPVFSDKGGELIINY